MRFTPEFIEKVQESNNLLDVISQYTQLRPVGGGFMGRCPFPDHPEKTPSFSVSEAKQVFHCFGCQKRGNIFSFLQTYNGMSFVEAVEYLASRANIALPEVADPQADAATRRKKEIQQANQIASDFFFEQLKRLPGEHPVRKYLIKRGLSPETVETFKIGYAPAEWDTLVNHLQKRGVDLSLAEEAKLIKARKEGKTGYFDLFRDRLMFPIVKPTGETLAFGGRIITTGEPKYLNSPETLAFSKGKVLYGLNESAKYIRTEDQVVVVEGYMDFVSLYQAGIQNLVATMGTALTPEHGRMIRRLTKNVVVLFDGDSAGQNAAERSLPILLAADTHPKGVTLPDNQDPDDFVKANGAEALKTILNQAKDLYTQQLTLWLSDYRGEASQKLQLADRLKPILPVIQDPRLKDLYISEAADKLGVGVDWMKKAIFGDSAPHKTQPAAKSVPSANPSTPVGAVVAVSLQGASRVEAILMSLVLKDRKHLDAFVKAKIEPYILHKGVQTLLEKAKETYGQSPEKFDKLVGLLTSMVDKPELLFLAWDQSSKTAPVQSDEDVQENEETKLLQDCFKKVRDGHFKQQADQLALELKVNPTPEKLEQFMNIQRTRKQMSKD